MSAGSGIYHSEFNPSKENEVNLLQIWVFLNSDIEPRYDQKNLMKKEEKSISGSCISETDNGSLWLNQNVYFNIGNFDAGAKRNL